MRWVLTFFDDSSFQTETSMDDQEKFVWRLYTDLTWKVEI